MTELEIYKQAIIDFNEACDKFNGKPYTEKSIDEILESLNKYNTENFDENLFDFNYGVICITVYNRNGICEVGSQGIEVWDDSNLSLLDVMSIEEIKQKVKELLKF